MVQIIFVSIMHNAALDVWLWVDSGTCGKNLFFRIFETSPNLASREGARMCGKYRIRDNDLHFEKIVIRNGRWMWQMDRSKSVLEIQWCTSIWSQVVAKKHRECVSVKFSCIERAKVCIFQLYFLAISKANKFKWNRWCTEISDMFMALLNCISCELKLDVRDIFFAKNVVNSEIPVQKMSNRLLTMD